MEQCQRKDERSDEFNAEVEHERLGRKKSARRPDHRMNLPVRITDTQHRF